MNTLQRAYRYFLAEPFYWIFLVFFQPNRFRREYEMNYTHFWQRVVPMLRLILPSFLVCYPLTVLIEVILIPFHALSHVEFIFILVVPMISIAVGIVVGIVFGIAVDIAFGIVVGIIGGIGSIGGIVVGIAFGIAVSIVVGIARGIGVSIAFGIIFGIIFGIVRGISAGIGVSIVFGIVFGIAGASANAGGSARGSARGIDGGIIFGIVIGIVGGIVGGIIEGIVGGIALSIAFLIGYYRLPLYLASGTSSFIAYSCSRQNPPGVFNYLQNSSLHWDERVYLRLPYLKRILLIACDEDSQQALEEIRFIDAERPQQLWAAQSTILELAMRDLELCQTLRDIEAVHRRIEELFTRQSKLMNPQWATLFAYLDSASRDAQRYTTPISRRAKQEALTDLLEGLKRIRPNVAFRDQRMNARLARVIETWTQIAQAEQLKLESIVQAQGTLDNPYKPGIVLQNVEGNIFVGRRDIAEQLESALRSQGNPPTFLLNGERRMGKTSTLVQLPGLLGSRYISVFYNLQSPGIYANIAVFLEWLAERLQHELQSRDIKVRSLSLQIRGQSPSEQAPNAPRQTPPAYQNDAFAYHGFNRWLGEVEKLLERDGKMVLLAFDEFEMFDKVGADGLLNLPTLFDWFRELIQFHPRIAILFSGVSRLDEMGTPTGISWSNYFINVRTLPIGLLQPVDARKLIVEPTELFSDNDVYSNEVVECIIQQTGCHPLLIQATCSELIDMLNAERRERATLQDIKHTIEKVLETWSGYFGDQWERTDQNQRAILALLLAGPTDIASLELQSRLDDKMLRQTMKMLLRRDLVQKNDDETYEMTMPMFGRWMRLNNVV